MRTRPKGLVYLAVFLMMLSLGMPLQIMFLYDHGISEYQSVFAKLAPMNWTIMVLAPLTAVLLLRASPWLLAAVPALVVVVLHNNWFVAEMSTDYSPMMVGFSTGIFLLSLGMLLTRQIRQVVLNPGLRWWLTPARKQMQVPVSIEIQPAGKEDSDPAASSLAQGKDNTLYASTFDLSKGGVFVTAPEIPIGTVCKLKIKFSNDLVLECMAQVVRSSKAQGHYPAGVGLSFKNMGWNERRTLTYLLEQDSKDAGKIAAA